MSVQPLAAVTVPERTAAQTSLCCIWWRRRLRDDSAADADSARTLRK
jgi:hypothetical protein